VNPIKTLFLTATFFLASQAPLHAIQVDENWPQFRGSDSTGVVQAPSNLPEVWSATQNIAWKTDIPGRGWSSPIVWGNRIYLTTVVNSEDAEEPKKGLYFGGDRPKPPQTNHQWIAVCLDLQSGRTLWSKTLHEGNPETAIHLKNSFASETPVTDGKNIYILFGGVGVYCLDLEGNLVWMKAIEPRHTRYGWGTAASPVLDGDRIYIVDDNEEESSLLALNKNNGEEVWRIQRDEHSNWATPYIWKNAQRTEIVTVGSDQVRSYDLQGQPLWSLQGMSSITIATPYQHKGMLLVSSGYVGDRQRPLYAIQPGGSGDISLAKDQTSNQYIAWCQPTGAPYNPSTLALNGKIYVLHDQGFLSAFDAKSGSEVFPKNRIRKGRAFTASPWSYNGKIFCLNEDGVTFVFQGGSDFQLLNTNELADDDMGMATPAIAGDRLLIRTSSRLYCVQNAKQD